VGRHGGRRTRWLPAAALAGGAAVVFLAGHAAGDVADDPTRSTAQPVGAVQARSGASNEPVDPVSAARRLKPLLELEPGDRVLFDRRVYTFRKWAGTEEWAKTRQHAWVGRPGSSRVQVVQTGALTPVERIPG